MENSFLLVRCGSFKRFKSPQIFISSLVASKHSGKTEVYLKLMIIGNIPKDILPSFES